MSQPNREIAPGFMVIQGNRMEDLQQIAIEWSRTQPLAPLEREVYLVQSNGIAQWMKMALAADPGTDGAGGMGIATALDVMLPARFQWLAYRQVIEQKEGKGAVPTASPFDKPMLRWRLMRMLPEKLSEPVYAPLAKFLDGDDGQRKQFQLAERLADLYDQYQVYRADWLDQWTAGHDRIISPKGVEVPLQDEDRWQAQLWRDIHDDMPSGASSTHRAAVHSRFLEVARNLTPETLPTALPRRIVVFGISALPQQTLEALEALSGAAQVVLCVLNPCQHYWGDIIEDKDLLRTAYRRQSRRNDMPADLSLDDLHLHAHPLLAAWGKQGRDYLHLLDEHDEMESYHGLFQHHGLRVDAFESSTTSTLLGQMQDDILNLRPPQESLDSWPEVEPSTDRSIQFSVAHSAQREVEILHDQLLDAFDGDPSLQPRDVIVMVPDADSFAPYFHAVFGQYGFQDRRYIPYQLADQRQRHHAPLMVALETLLQLPQLRISASEVLDLLDVPAIRQRFGLQAGDTGTLKGWIEHANIRWGLHAEQRADLGLPDHDERNSWRFGLARMMSGFALGATEDGVEDWDGIAPFEVGGLDAALVGPLHHLITTLGYYWDQLRAPRPVSEWGPLLRQLLNDCFSPESKLDQRLMLALQEGLERWLEECESAAFDEPMPLAIVRDTWLDRVDEAQLSQRFMGGTVTIATLMPMRAIPFRHVYLLGMNDGDYPRQQALADFDIMRRSGQYRPGDRSRREDDRYLLLEALMSARERLAISWSGRSIRDNTERTPSVLVGQLRDHIASAWRLQGATHPENAGVDLVKALTTEHPLQPFSRAYFNHDATRQGQGAPQDFADARLFTYASEWEHLHENQKGGTSPIAPEVLAPLPTWAPDASVTLRQLASFLRRPIDQIYRQRLGVYFHDLNIESDDAEPFGFNHLDVWKQQDAVLQPVGQGLSMSPDLDVDAALERAVEARKRQGEMPHEPFTHHVSEAITAPLHDQLHRYQQHLLACSGPVTPMPGIKLAHTGLLLEDTIDHVYTLRESTCIPKSTCARIVLETSKLHEGERLKWTSLVKHWPAHLALQCVAPESPTIVVGQTGDVVLSGMLAETARHLMEKLMSGWLDGMHRPLPLTCKAGFRALDNQVWEEDGGDWGKVESDFLEEQGQSLTIRRHYSDFGTLLDGGEFRILVESLYTPLHRLVTEYAKENA